MVSARALIIRLPIARSFAQNGTSPPWKLRELAPAATIQPDDGHRLRKRDVVPGFDLRRFLQPEGERDRRGRGMEFVATAHPEIIALGFRSSAIEAHGRSQG
jgi:hypothetical protein